MTSKDLVIVEPIASEILEWIQRNISSDQLVRMEKIGDHYEVHIRYLNGLTAGPWSGPTLRDAYVVAMSQYDMGSLPHDDPFFPSILPSEPPKIVDTMDNALILDVKYLPKKESPE